MPKVREVLIRPLVSSLPLTPGHLVGLTRFRGACLPVFEVGNLLNNPADEPVTITIRSRIVVCQDENTLIGLQADGVDQASVRHEDTLPCETYTSIVTRRSDLPEGQSLLMIDLSLLFNQLHTSIQLELPTHT